MKEYGCPILRALFEVTMVTLRAGRSVIVNLEYGVLSKLMCYIFTYHSDTDVDTISLADLTFIPPVTIPVHM